LNKANITTETCQLLDSDIFLSLGFYISQLVRFTCIVL